MMSVTSAARRLLRTLSLSQPTVTTDLQRDGRGGPAADGRWWRAAVDGAGTDSGSTSSSCFELELWPAQSANSRRLPPSSILCSSSFSPSADRHDGRYYSELGGKTSKPNNAARLRVDTTLSPHRYILGDPKTVLPPATSHTRLLPRTDSSNSVASSASTLVSSASCASDNSEGIRKRKSACTPSIVPWNGNPVTGRRGTRSDAAKRCGDEESEVLWRGYWD
ncbi:hypothetical protein F5B21DRAFT_434662 [Xylaria acuta]|nr:hypothetical protein F5B21DRAFT_434662 [Xylaria acuta]